ncbi:hypothetical protein evm_010791 [Chilo suppressalis]|nr:hypothetical protein evm_010791 [Chilo suppressalis]
MFMEKELLKGYSQDDPRIADIKNRISIIKHDFKRKWLAAHKIKKRFEENNTTWLKSTITLPSAGVSPGRPQKSFENSSERSKRRRTEDLRSKDVVELTYATQMKLRHVVKIAASKVVKDLSKSPQRAKTYVKAFKKSSEKQDQPRQLSPLQALSMFTEAELTKAQYERVRETNPYFFPCYSVLQKVKKDTYPEIHHVTETCAEVLVQNLMDHTASRLIQHLGEAVEGLNEEEKRSLILISKWGCDGSQQVQYKMKFDCEYDSDANIFQTSVVPLQLIYSSEKKILWQNPTPSSPRYCRPIRIRFVKETTDVTNEEMNYIQSQISTLSSTNINDTSIKHRMLFTMVDGKVCNAATHTKSTMRCYICDATVSEFNDLSNERPCKKENFSFGLSLLHARIRFFESVLHVAYRLTVNKWNVRLSTEEKQKVEDRKKDIQNKFKEKLGLLVDMPKANFGNTNDGNTSRRFFEEYEISAEITGINRDLIYRLKVILDTLCSGLKINIERFEKFEKYCQKTAELYVSLYRFYPMSPTLHKVLRHGAAVIKESILPIGQLSEEAAEARNKNIRSYRLNFSRKFSRVECNMDVLNRLLLTSDPLITGMRGPFKPKQTQSKRKKKQLSTDILNLGG